MPEPTPGSRLRHPAGMVCLVLATLGLFALRFFGPPDLLDRDQERPASYILDVLRHGHWIVQTDWYGNITSKPPLYTWFAAILSWPTGRLTPFTLYLPCLLATLGCVLLIHQSASRAWGSAAGIWGGMLYLGTYLVARQICLARTDALFAVTVAIAAFLAFRAWSEGRGWTPFWLAAAAATLTKGPLGLALAASGLLAVAWESRAPQAARIPLRGSQLPGLALFLVLTVGWFIAALATGGDAVMQKLVRQELLNPGYTSDDGFAPVYLRPFYPVLYLLGRFLPAALFTAMGVWRVLSHPSLDDATRRWERFLTCWLLAGLAIFAVPKHQRADHLIPLLVPAAILAGREVALLLRRLSLRASLAAAGVTGAVLITLHGGYYYHVSRARHDLVRKTIELRELVSRLRTHHPAHPPIRHLDTPFALQFYLGTKEPMLAPTEAASALLGLESVWIATANSTSLTTELPPGTPEPLVIDQAPAHGTPWIQILAANRTSSPTPRRSP